MSKLNSDKPFKKSSPFEKFYKKSKEDKDVPASLAKHFKKLDEEEAKKRDRPKTALDFKIKKRINELQKPEISVKEEKTINAQAELRLNKFLSHAGVASRRKADELILEGRVKVNGEVVKELGFKVKRTDKITFDDKRIVVEKKIYILINKPKDCITTVSDERDRRTVLDLIEGAYTQLKLSYKPRLYPVGRLDRNTTGVMLITNDGELAQNLTHPSKEIKKIYHVFLDKKLREDDFEKIKQGVVLEDGIAQVDDLAYTNPKSGKEVGVEIHSGKNRIVRRIFESLGYEVEKLDRVYFGGLTKKEIPRGRWRFLSEEEVRNLKHFKL